MPPCAAPGTFFTLLYFTYFTAAQQPAAAERVERESQQVDSNSRLVKRALVRVKQVFFFCTSKASKALRQPAAAARVERERELVGSSSRLFTSSAFVPVKKVN
jgi:hypothetical protein